MAEAVAGVDIVVHCAGSQKGDGEKARRLVEAAGQAGVRGRFMREHMQDYLERQNEQKRQMREYLDSQIQEKKNKELEKKHKELQQQAEEEHRL